MRYTFLVLVGLVGCYDIVDHRTDCDNDAGLPRNQDNTDGGICCQITHRYPNGPDWMSGFYRCVEPGDPPDPFNPPWICNSTFEGQCGGDTGLECLTCVDTTCVVGMRCRDVDGTGTVVPCK